MKKFFLSICSLFLCLVSVFSFVGCSQSATSNSNVAQQNKVPSHINGTVPKNGLSMYSETINPSDYATYNVSDYAVSAKYVTVAVTPANLASIVTLDWSAEFVNPNSTWAIGKKVEDYVTVSEYTDNLTAIVECLQPFCEQVKINAVYTRDASVSASCFCDFKPRLEEISVSFKGSGYSSVISTQTLKANDNEYKGSSFYHLDDPWGGLYCCFNSLTFTEGSCEVPATYSVKCLLTEGFKQALSERGFSVSSGMLTLVNNATLTDDVAINIFGAETIMSSFFFGEETSNTLLNATYWAIGEPETEELTDEMVEIYNLFLEAITYSSEALEEPGQMIFIIEVGDNDFYFHVGFESDKLFPSLKVESISVNDSNLVF